MTFYLCKKKYTFLLLLVGMFAGSLVYAETDKTAFMNGEGSVSGDFTIYRDYSWKTPTWIGFLYYDDETYGAVLYTPEKNSRVSILFSCDATKKTLELTGQRIISHITKEDTFAVNYLMSILPKLYAHRVFPKGRSGIFSSITKKIDEALFGGTAEVQYDSYIPLFHIKTLKDAKKNVVLELEEIGALQGKPDIYFYNYEPSISKQPFKHFKRNKKAKKQSVKVFDYTFKLDSGWKKIADTSFLYGDTAFLTATGLKIPAEKSVLKPQERLIRYFLSSGQNAKVLLPHTRISGTENRFTLSQSVYDVQLKKVNKDIKCCIKNDDGSYTVLSLTVDSHAYSTDTAYFNALFPFF